MLRNSFDPDSDFWLDPDSMNMDPKHCSKVEIMEPPIFTLKVFFCIFPLNFHLLDPEPGGKINVDPDPGGKINADPCGSGSTALITRLRLHFF